MKQLMLALLVSLGAGLSYTASAQQTTTTTTTTTSTERPTKYYYYPSSNVYYNPATDDYWYYDEGNTTWTTVKQLPSTVTVTKEPRYTVYYKGTDVWKDNAQHLKKYKTGKHGQVKAKQ